MEHMQELIMKAGDDEITQIAELLIRRQKILHPEWEGVFLSFPVKHREQCREIMLGVWNLLNVLWREEAQTIYQDKMFSLEG